MSLRLPEKTSYEYLKKLAKERLARLRANDPAAKLADAQFAVARDYGFTNWRALKAEVDLRRAPHVAAFARACTDGDPDAMRTMLAEDPSLARETLTNGSTALHLAAKHPDAVRLLLEHGADPNLRDTGDRATPLHYAAANGSLESVRALLDAGADVHGHGDLHEGDAIGWAARIGNEAVIELLLARGARHHIFSAMALRDRELVQKLVEDDPDQLLRRRSRFENAQTPVHAAFVPPDGLGFLAGAPDYAMLQVLLDLGADVDAPDDRGRTPLAIALLRRDDEAIRILRAAGAAEPPAVADGQVDPAAVKKSTPMFWVHDVRATVAWYESIGFTTHDRYEDSGDLVFARLTLGEAELTLSPGGTSGPRDVKLWLYTDRLDDLYAALARYPSAPFEEDLYTPFYGGRQFSVRDPNGLTLIFWQPPWLA
ncbi:MAG: ankyrin repeat domain-containing protein [Acidobacteria bacterium]|nr:ankyrin repeat domain-containing protein [Acidobacteriota bacterium]